MPLPLLRSVLTCSRSPGGLSILRTAFYSKYSKRELQRVWTIPNALSISRIVVAPLVGHAVLTDRPGLAVSLLVLCGISDVADGYIARRYHQKSALGSIIDPLSDKLLVGVLTGVLVWKGLLPVWLAGMILARDAGLILSGVYVRWRSLAAPITWSKFVDPAIATATVNPTVVSKINTALQIVLLGSSLLSPVLASQYGLDIGTPLSVLQYSVAATTVWSSISYATNFRRVIKFIKK